MRWVCYAWPLTVDEKWAIDGSNAGYIAWIRDRWREWKVEHGRDGLVPPSAADHRAFDEWLVAKCGVVFEGDAAAGGAP